MPVATVQELEVMPAAGGIGLDDLRELMRHVTDTTLSLQQTHHALQSQVARLQSELAEANRQLSRSRQLAALGEMAAGIAHEIRNPLGSIQLYVQMLGEDLADRPEQQELCRKVATAVSGVDAIIHDVLAFSRETRMAPQVTSAQVIIERTIETCAGLISKSNAKLHISVSTETAVFADGMLMVQALGNVVRNAIEAMGERPGVEPRLNVGAGVCTVRCPDGRRRRRMVFTVRDYGPGIAPDVIERMFNPFFTTRAAGTGLGLAIVHRIIDAHGGHINVRNASDLDEGSGAIIELCLPCRATDVRQVAMCKEHHDDDSGTLLPQEAA